MKIPGDRIASCNGKKGFATEAMAQRAGHRFRLVSYLCPHCKRWHNGSNLGKRKKTLNEKISHQYGIAALRRILDE